MSLTRLLSNDEMCRDLVDSLLLSPPELKKENHPAIVSVGKENANKVGTAVDYAIRFELKRLIPSSIETAWIAEKSVFADTAVPARRFANKYRQSRGYPSKKTLRDLARHCLNLAEIDMEVRAGDCSLICGDYGSAEINAVVDIFNVCPWPDMLQQCRDLKVWLNPTFGAASEIVGRADADLILGKTLVDIKTVPVARIDRRMLRQLVGYYLLEMANRTMGARAPAIRFLGVLFARQGFLWTAPVDKIIDVRKSGIVSAKFMKRALEIRTERRNQREQLRAFFRGEPSASKVSS